MKALIAFKTNTQAYVLPVAGGVNLSAVVSQPKFVPLIASEGLPVICGVDLIKEWTLDCEKPDLLSSQSSRQRIYCWWMSLTNEERATIYKSCI